MASADGYESDSDSLKQSFCLLAVAAPPSFFRARESQLMTQKRWWMRSQTICGLSTILGAVAQSISNGSDVLLKNGYYTMYHYITHEME